MMPYRPMATRRPGTHTSSPHSFRPLLHCKPNAGGLKHMSRHTIDRRALLQRGIVGGLGLAGLTTFLDSYDLGTAFAGQAGAATNGLDPMLVAAAQKNGHLNVITLPRDWANYGELMDTFKARYKIGITDAIPDGSSAQEVSAIKTLKGQSRAPDAVDVGPAWAAKGVQGNLFEVYKVATWSSIPANMKEPTGLWTGDYYGVPAFLSVNSVVKQAPTDWSD